ncbi:MAG: class I SAM-dependent methyltransferase [Candidatus Hydrogenedentes bacterium]|nr:class I SAM-dependent methyltransferase [Candidatus Hydrogenedentota bacterium]
MNSMHLANQKWWDAASANWARGADSRGLWPRCPTEPELALCPKALAYFEDATGKRVCVLGSGDNQVVFALAGLGVAVTSVDISQKQLDVAARRAKELGLSISFQQADVTDLSAFANDAFDSVYTGGHVAVWVSDLQMYYSEAVRILRPGGFFIVDEYHPFRRLWKNSRDALVVENPYFERGPFEYEESAAILQPEPGPWKTYEFHWTVSDYMNAVLKTGCSLELVDEYGEDVEREGAPLHGLPEFLLIVGQKPVR